MKKITLLLLTLILVIGKGFAQTDPVLSIDGTITTFKSGLSLPYWLKAGQTVGLVSGVISASILEFTVDNENLKYSQTISLTSTQTVPTGKVWKIEGLGMGSNGGGTISGFSNGVTPTIFTSPKTYSSPGTYSWKVPPGVVKICIEVWGPGANADVNGGGGGGGYGYQCFSVTPGTDHIIHVGNNAISGDSTYFDNLIVAFGGSSNGQGGNSSAFYNLSGGNSAFLSNTYYPNSTSIGGAGANGGNGGNMNVNQGIGGFPGGGGGWQGYPYNLQIGAGASGQVKIYW